MLACVVLTACGDPIAEFPRLSEQDLPDNASVAEVAATPAPEGTSLFAQLLGGANTTEESAVETPQTETPAVEETAEASSASTAEKESADVAAPAKPTGLLALLTRAAPPKQDVIPDNEAAQPLAVALTGTEGGSADTQGALPESPDVDPTPGTKHKSIFGIAAAKPPVATSEIPPGTVLPYGKLARVCGVPKREMGKQVAQFPENRPKHRIYDTAPGSTAPHTFYITGFDDGCARQFTASLAMFGSVEMHEQLRYGLPAEVQPYSDTDKAYETLKARVCKVPRRKPCGSKISRLGNGTVFVSIYERFGSNARWKNLLLHDGDVLAQDIKGG